MLERLVAAMQALVRLRHVLDPRWRETASSSDSEDPGIEGGGMAIAETHKQTVAGQFLTEFCEISRRPETYLG